ncbi:toxin-antitoxin system YwqK family antitoxin [Streptomyces sp. NPDC004050]
MDALRKIDIDDPDVDMDEAQRLTYRGELYTGEVVEYLGGSLVSQESYASGIRDGLSREWYKDGRLRAEGVVRRGRPRGEFLEWHPNGVLKSRQVFNDSGMVLEEEYEWDETGRQTRAWTLTEN